MLVQFTSMTAASRVCVVKPASTRMQSKLGRAGLRRVSLAVRTGRGIVSARASRLVVRATVATPTGTGLPPAIVLTPLATTQLIKLRDEQGGADLCLRVGVKQGGCSGMSYVMDLEERANISDSDSIIDDPTNGFAIVVDPKSLLYLFGLQLDYSTELIGGGFQFANPNAEDSCGCGKSFNA